MSKNVSLSFTSTPELRDTLTDIASRNNTSRSKTIFNLVTEALAAPAAQASYSGAIKQLDLAKLIELFDIYGFYSFDNEGEPPLLECYLDLGDLPTEASEREAALLQRFFELADEVNEILWQIDNTVCLSSPYADAFVNPGTDIYDICEKLVSYGLLKDESRPYEPATAAELWSYLRGRRLESDRLGALLNQAVYDKEYSIIVGVLPWSDPVERGVYWKDYYTAALGTEKVSGVFDWKANPEAYEVNDELATVLSWDEPKQDVKSILDVLHENRDPFYKEEPKAHASGGYVALDFGAWQRRGRYADHAPDKKATMRSAFKCWHNERLQELGQERLSRCYQVVFGCDWDVIEALVCQQLSGAWYEVLGVSPNCTRKQLKEAYRSLARQYHPDTNKSQSAENTMKVVNRAYETGAAVVGR